MLYLSKRLAIGTFALILHQACERLEQVGRTPSLSASGNGSEVIAMTSSVLPEHAETSDEHDAASLWAAGRRSLLGDRRAQVRGDILTVLIEIDDSAQISNSTGRSRSGNESLAIPEFFGIPQRIDDQLLPDGTSLSNAVDAASTSASSGQGSVTRNEELTLRIAATVTEILPNGVLRIQGSQEVRVNFEVRELTISGFVRPEDISRRNDITYDKIAAARISYGGRGQITDVQQPRLGQQITDIILPF